MSMARRRTRTTGLSFAAVAILLALAGCGGTDAGLNITSPPPEATVGSAVRISGVVRMPNGQVAQAPPSVLQRFASLAVSAAEALSANTVRPVGAGVNVH